MRRIALLIGLLVGLALCSSPSARAATPVPLQACDPDVYPCGVVPAAQVDPALTAAIRSYAGNVLHETYAGDCSTIGLSAAGMTCSTVYDPALSGGARQTEIGIYGTDASLLAYFAPTASGWVFVKKQNYPPFPGCFPAAGSAVDAIQQFYDLIDAGDVGSAWCSLSPGYTQGRSFRVWAAGYYTTLRVQAQNAPTSSDSAAYVDLLATDSIASGGTMTRHFAGTWSLVYSPGRQGWLLDSADISVLP